MQSHASAHRPSITAQVEHTHSAMERSPPLTPLPLLFLPLLLLPLLLARGTLGVFLLPRDNRAPQAPISWKGDLGDWCSFDFEEPLLSQHPVGASECQKLCRDIRACTRWDAKGSSGAPNVCRLYGGAPKKSSARPVTQMKSGYSDCGVVQRIAWRDKGDWAEACDFPGNDLFAAHGTPGEACSGICSRTDGCTHYSWTSFSGGTCWMKRGLVSRLDAAFTGDYSTVCGVIADRIPHLPGSPYTWLEDDEILNVVNYAPLLRFDSKATENCLPSSAEDYFKLRKSGSRSRVCNADYGSIDRATVPVYYSYQVCGGAVIIMYWFFYGYQGRCMSLGGSHDADWERVVVKIERGSDVTRVMYYQHKGQYTRLWGNLELVAEDQRTAKTHPVVYVGKVAHGSYHDSGGSVLDCAYWEDFRKPGSPDMKMKTWLNLQKLRKDASAPEWMREEPPSVFEISPPLHRGENLCELKPCVGGTSPLCVDVCGCSRSDVQRGFF